MKKLVLFFSFCFIILSYNKKNSIKNNDIIIKYYGTFSGYSHPINLHYEFKKKDISSYNPHIVGYYKHDKLIKVEKYLDNQLFFAFEYLYENDELVKVYSVIDGNKKEIKLVK